MRRAFPLFLLGFALAGSLFADDQTREVQSALKDQGFYFGEVDGEPGTATSAAIKRYQIRNGLPVSGDLNAETLQALGVAGQAPAPAPSNQVSPAPVQPDPGAVPVRPPLNLRRAATPEYAAEDPPARVARPPAARPDQPGQDGPPNQPSERYRAIFAGTPYMNAPRVVQEETYLRAQRTLSGRGFLNAQNDASPAAMEEGLLAYQRSARLPMSGLLDLETLGALHLLPGRGVDNPRVEPAKGTGRIPAPRPYPEQFAR